ncbi:MAG TPA: ATP-binding protein [Streptosporangiaceae bacterium]
MTDQLARATRPRPGDQAPPGPDGPARIWARTRLSFSETSWSLRRRLAVTFAVAATLLVLGCALGGLALNSMVSAVDLQVNRLDPGARSSSYLLAAALNEETGVRGYIITRQQSFLQPYHQGVAESHRQIRALHQLIDAYPRLRVRLDQVEKQAAIWDNRYAEPTIASVKAGRPPGPLMEALGKHDFDKLRAGIGALRTELGAERTAALARLHRATTGVILIAITGAVALIAAGAAAWAAMVTWVIRPLAALGDEAQVVASGGLEHQLTISGPREVIELGADVEAMRRQLLSSLDDLSFKAGELERSNRELEQFAYVASHDLQEPLRKVASFCQMLESRYSGQLDDRARQYIGFAVDGAKRMQLLINELLTFSRVGQPGTARGPVDLNAVASEAVDRLDAMITDTEARVEIGDLPQVTGDATLLTQLFQNLIANSIKFRRVDQTPVVSITAVQAGQDWEFACQDNGIGISPDHAERVFVIFQRLHPRDAYPGTGIGLALCRKIVDFHGGRIWVDTRTAGPGTTIRWTLPAPEEAEED